MSPNVNMETFNPPTTLQEAVNLIKYMKTTHKQEIFKLKETSHKQAEIIKKLEATRKMELEYLSSELHKYEVNLALRTESVTKELALKDEIINKQAEIIESLKNKLKEYDNQMKDIPVPEITILNVDSNSDSGIAMDSNDSINHGDITGKPEAKLRKCRRFAESINFLRRVDFSPIKYKPSQRDITVKPSKKDESRKNSLDTAPPNCKRVDRLLSVDKLVSDYERPKSADPCFSDCSLEPIILRPKQINDSMNNHFSDDASEDTSEEVFNRVMTRSSVRRSVKANPKYKKINRTKSKLLGQVKVSIGD